MYVKDWEECTRHYQQIIESEFKRPEYEEKSNINLQHMHFCWYVSYFNVMVCEVYPFINTSTLMKFSVRHTYLDIHSLNSHAMMNWKTFYAFSLNIYLLSLRSARNSYKNCIYNSALSKCNARSAKFARDLVDLLSNERQFKNCAEIEKTSLCSGAVSFRVFINNLSQLTITTLAISLMMLMMAVDEITSL